MATITVKLKEDCGYARIASEDEGELWNGSEMEAKGDVSPFGSAGVITPTRTASGTGGDILHEVTLPGALPDDTDTNYWLYFYLDTPVEGAQRHSVAFRIGSGTVIAVGGWGEGTAGGGGLSEEEVQALIDASVAGIVPIAATLTDFSVPKIDLPLGQYESRTFQITFTDADGDPVSFQNDTVTCVVSTIRGTTAMSEVSCTVASTNYNVIQVPFTSAHTASAGTFRHYLWSETDDARVAYGAVPIARGLAPTT